MLKSKGGFAWIFSLDGKALNAKGESGLDGNVETSRPAEWAYPPFSIKLDPVLLQDAVKHLASEQVELWLGEDRQPLFMKESADGLRYQYLLGARV
jgi:hypothetical protein